MCHNYIPPPSQPLHCCCYGTENTATDTVGEASVNLMVTYIGGLHSSPMAQPTAIHPDIQLGGEEWGGGRLTQPRRWMISGQDQGPHSSADSPQPELDGIEPTLL